MVGSLRHRTLLSDSNAAVVDALVSDPLLPRSSSLLRLALDHPRHRLFAAVHSPSSLYYSPSALVAYDLPSCHCLFLTPSMSPTPATPPQEPTTLQSTSPAMPTSPTPLTTSFGRSQLFMANSVEHGTPYSSFGLNGIAYISKGYLLVVQSNTEKLFKVKADDGATRTVLLNKDLTAGDGIAVGNCCDFWFVTRLARMSTTSEDTLDFEEAHGTTKSGVWSFYIKSTTDEGKVVSECKYCQKVYIAGNSHGTSNMRRHLRSQCLSRNNPESHGAEVTSADLHRVSDPHHYVKVCLWVKGVRPLLLEVGIKTQFLHDMETLLGTLAHAKLQKECKKDENMLVKYWTTHYREKVTD
ncbi:hypothetical protein RJ640_003150 [Escallonia rubra]|uniref:BED-type domain-containing protein n=1 Tax=Escallonia rubra TaxID=112253 RepID=A0AA88RJM8_9ASTE|nr:hypothetical protein RJ640_003150 [Escallonia rubra]